MGRREAFGIVAGRCSAAEVESLRQIRDGKTYRELDCTWSDFCTRYLHVSRRSVDRAIGYLDEFGPAFFHVSMLAHISPKDYRSIAPHVTDRGVEIDDNVVALLTENSDRVSAAVAELLKRIECDDSTPSAPQFEQVLKRCQTTAEMVEALPSPLDRVQKIELAAAVNSIRDAAASLGIKVAI
jgi:hypothetical protein